MPAPPGPGGEVSLLMHLCNPCFGAEDARAVEALVALAEQERPEVVLASGSITRRARPAEFDAARRFFARLAARHTLVLAGPRDITRWDLPRRLLAPYAAFRSTFGSELEPRLACPQAWIACLGTASRWRARDRDPSRGQVLRSAQWLSAAPEHALRTVVLQLAPDEIGASTERRGDAASAWAVDCWREAGVNLVLAGDGEPPQVRAIGDGRPLWLARGGSALARRAPPVPHTVHLLRRGFGDAWRLERWVLAIDRHSFVRQHWQELRDSAAAAL